MQDNTYHGLCYTSRGALAGTRNSLMGSPHCMTEIQRIVWVIYSLVCAEVNNVIQEITVTKVRTSHIFVKARISQSDGGILK